MNNLNTDLKAAVVSHVNPDGDSLGSVLALGMALEAKGMDVTVFVNDSIPEMYGFLPTIDRIIPYSPEQGTTFDQLYVLDCGDEHRIGDGGALMGSAKQVINIDHHVSNRGFGDINLVDPHASSTCEMIYGYIQDTLQVPITAAMALCLYTGIATDTGNFQYDTTSATTHRIAADLLEKGVNLQMVTYHLYQNQPLQVLKLLAHLLSTMESHLGGKVILMEVDQQMMEAYQVQYDQLDGMINYGRDIAGVEVAAILKEQSQGGIKLSLRSKTDFDVSQLAQAFGGGGHRKAAGATVSGTMAEVKEALLSKIQEMM